MQEMWVWFFSREDSLEKEMATHSSILAWKTLWTEEHGRLQFMGITKRDGHDLVMEQQFLWVQIHIFIKYKSIFLLKFNYLKVYGIYLW